MMETQRGYTAEEAVIGSILCDAPYALPKVKGILNPEHFKDYTLSQVYEMAMKIDGEGKPVDIITVCDRLTPVYRKIVLDICHNFPGAYNVETYRNGVMEAYHQRRLRETMMKGASAQSVSEDVIEKINREWKGINSVPDRRFDFSDKLASYTDILEKRAKKGELFFKTGFPTLDYKIPFLKRGEFCVVGARTSMGKTALLLGMMLQMAKQGVKIVYCSGEMSFYQLMDRIIALETDIPLLSIRKGEIRSGDWPRILDVLSNVLETLKLRFVEAPSLTFRKIIPHLNDFRPDVLFVDFIQRFSPEGKVDTRAAFYSDVANTLKGLSIERDIAVVAASQMGRDVEHRKGEPRLSDLKESGGLEESADVVWALHREETSPVIGHTDYKMLILKNRNGPTFSFQGMFDEKRAAFCERES